MASSSDRQFSERKQKRFSDFLFQSRTRNCFIQYTPPFFVQTWGDSSHLVHDGTEIALLLHPDGTIKQRQFWGATTDELICEEKNNIISWTLCDYLGTVRDLLDSNGNIINHLEYNAFGILTSATSPANLPLFRYTAKPFDTTTNLQYNVNRWYDSLTGRWLTTDPIGFLAGDANLYRYVGNTPTISIDINGRCEWGVCIDVTTAKKMEIIETTRRHELEVPGVGYFTILGYIPKGQVSPTGRTVF